MGTLNVNQPTLRLFLYSKPECHLCEGLQEKLAQITSLSLDLEIRDITTREDWFQVYQYEIPVLGYKKMTEGSQLGEEMILPRPSPRCSVAQLEKMLHNYIDDSI